MTRVRRAVVPTAGAVYDFVNELVVMRAELPA